jgi:MFS family permease
MQVFKRLTNQFNLSGFPPAIWAIAGMNIIGGIGWSTSFTYLSLYLYQERSIPMTLVGVVLLISGISSGVCQIIGGIMGDRFGHRRMVVLFSLAGVLASTVLAILIGVKAPTWSVVLSAIMVPTLGAGAYPPLNAIIAGVSPKDRLTESYSLQAIAGNVAWAIGPLLGGFMLGFASFSWLFGIGAVVKAIGLVGILFLPGDLRTEESKRTTGVNLKSLTSNPNVIIFSLISLPFFLTMTQWGGTLSVFTVDRIGFSTEQYGLLMSISGILIIIFQYPISRRIGTENIRKALVLGCLFYAVGFLSLAWVKIFATAVGSIVIMVIGEMLFVPTALAAVGQLSGPEDKGKSMGFYGLCNTMGFSIGPLLGGSLLDAYPRTPLYVWGPISLCSFAAALGFGVWKGYTRILAKNNSESE